MSTFPDILHLGGDLFRIVTDDGFSWVHHNTNVPDADIPRLIHIHGADVVRDMESDGIRVRRGVPPG